MISQYGASNAGIAMIRQKIPRGQDEEDQVMALMMEDLERLETQALRRIQLKTEQARKGNDWVADSHSITSHKLLELIALAKLGHPIWMASERADAAAAPPDPVQLPEQPVPLSVLAVQEAERGPMAATPMPVLASPSRPSKPSRKARARGARGKDWSSEETAILEPYIHVAVIPFDTLMLMPELSGRNRQMISAKIGRMREKAAKAPQNSAPLSTEDDRPNSGAEIADVTTEHSTKDLVDWSGRPSDEEPPAQNNGNDRLVPRMGRDTDSPASNMLTKLREMSDAYLGNLLANAKRLQQTGTPEQQSDAAILLPAVEAELDSRRPVPTGRRELSADEERRVTELRAIAAGDPDNLPKSASILPPSSIRLPTKEELTRGR